MQWKKILHLHRAWQNAETQLCLPTLQRKADCSLTVNLTSLMTPYSLYTRNDENGSLQQVVGRIACRTHAVCSTSITSAAVLELRLSLLQSTHVQDNLDLSDGSISEMPTSSCRPQGASSLPACTRLLRTPSMPRFNFLPTC